MDPKVQHGLLRLQVDLFARLRDVRDGQRALVVGMRAAREAFGAHEAAVATARPAPPGADLLLELPRGSAWDLGMLAAYLAGKRPPIPADTLLAPVKRRGRAWAVLALRRPEGTFGDEHPKAALAIGQIVTDAIEVLDAARARDVRRKIERKIADREDPKDLMYDILHGLRSLTHYDHSASLFIAKDASSPLTLVAEQIAWEKAKSRRIGLRIDLDDALRNRLRGEGIAVFTRSNGDWKQTAGDPLPGLPGLLAYGAAGSSVAPHAAPPEATMVVAPVSTPEGAVGVLRIAARGPGVLGSHEAALVDDFMPLASLAIQFSVRTETLRERILRAERKHVLADVARGIAHDVNNALGAMLPLVQQIREDAAAGTIDARTLADDLRYVERSVQTCRRIFGSMLAVARGSAPSVGQGNLRRAVDAALAVVHDTLKRKSIEVVLDLPEHLPAIRGAQGDLTQALFNVINNAKDAMDSGGRLTLSARVEAGSVLLAVEDTGSGIPAAELARVFEPFYTTKEEGNGLGLAICRSILRDLGGEIALESSRGKGTRVLLTFPLLVEPGREERA